MGHLINYINKLTHVIHVDVPRTVEQYLHRSGRTGRAGADGEVLAFVAYRDEKDFKKLTRDLPKKPIQKTWVDGQLVEGNAKTASKAPAKPSQIKKGGK